MFLSGLGDVPQPLFDLERRGDEPVHVVQRLEALGVLLRLAVEAGVLQRNGGLGREAAERLQVALGEARGAFFAAHSDHPEEPVVGHEGLGHRVADPEERNPVLRQGRGVRRARKVVHQQSLPLGGRRAGHADPQRDAKVADLGRHGVPGLGHQRPARRVEEEDDAAGFQQGAGTLDDQVEQPVGFSSAVSSRSISTSASTWARRPCSRAKSRAFSKAMAAWWARD